MSSKPANSAGGYELYAVLNEEFTQFTHAQYLAWYKGFKIVHVLKIVKGSQKG